MHGPGHNNKAKVFDTRAHSNPQLYRARLLLHVVVFHYLNLCFLCVDLRLCVFCVTCPHFPQCVCLQCVSSEQFKMGINCNLQYMSFISKPRLFIYIDVVTRARHCESLKCEGKGENEMASCT